MSVIFSPDTVNLTRVLAEQTAELAERLSQPASEIFLAQISGAFHDLESVHYDPRVRRTIKFAINEVRQGCQPMDAVERLETSLENHGVAWFMLDINRAQAIKSLEDLREMCSEEMAQRYVRAGSRPGDLVTSYSARPYENFYPHSLSTGMCLVRGNRILSVVTLIRS